MRIRITLLALLAPAPAGSVRQRKFEPRRFVFPLPLTERPLLDERPLASLDLPSPPPPPMSIEQQQLQHERVQSLSGLAIDARTRLVSSMAAKGLNQLSVKLSAGFRAGSLIVLNPGGVTEEQLTLRRADPFLLASPLRYSHGMGETVVQLASTEDVDTVAASADSSSSSSSAKRLSALLALRDRRAHVYHRPPPPPPHREAPLLGNITELTDGSSRFVRTHMGIEAALALLLAAVLSLCALGCIVQAACDYSLCCFSRGRKIADSREMSDV